MYGNRGQVSINPVLPLSPGRAARQGFEYDRHGALSFDLARRYRA
ncbi:MAG: hypothetical protein ACRD01_08505 [Terriglobales bacterium]